MRASPLQVLVGIALLGVGGAAAGPNPAIDELAQDTVSRLEWGLTGLERALVDTFALDPQTLEPSSPPFFVNVTYANDDGYILVEIGRTFAALGEAQADELCRDYVERVRSLLSIGRTGRPVSGSASSLAADFFHPPTAPGAPDPDFARTLDGAVRLRALVASPINGVFSICTAALTHSPVRFVE